MVAGPSTANLLLQSSAATIDLHRFNFTKARRRKNFSLRCRSEVRDYWD